jgi:purine-nucleoside phosphorylase
MSMPHYLEKFDSEISLSAKDMFFKSNNVSSLNQLPTAPNGCIFSPITKIKNQTQEKLTLETGPNIIKPIYLSSKKDLAIFCDFVGFGAPMWTWVFEQLITYGIKKFVYIGVFGNVNPKYDEDAVYVVQKALRDEGVSYHYTASADHWSHPDSEMTKTLEGMGAKPISIWTTDCMFRQTLSEIEYAKENDIAGFEMECSALFTVAKEKNVKISSLQVISDYYLDGKYTSIYSSDVCQKNLNKAVDMAIKILEA